MGPSINIWDLNEQTALEETGFKNMGYINLEPHEIDAIKYNL
jgi:hypothetical protein